MSRIFLLVVCTGLLLCTPKSPSGPSVNYYRNILEEVKSKVATSRGLNFKRTVHFDIITPDEYAEYNDSYISPALQLYAIELKQLGFIPDSMNNFGKTVESFNDNFAAAFYVPGTDSIYLIDSDKFNEIQLRYYLAHELTHALQDQNFNAFSSFIYPSQSQSLQNSDFFLAQLCVAEGDASYSGDFFITTEYDLMSEMELIDMYTLSRDTFFMELSKAEIPGFLQIRGMSPYILGQYFIASKKQSSGWTGVNSLFHSNRVSSSAEIITFKPQTLTSFDFNKISPILLENTTNLLFADDDTHGPVMLMALLKDYVDVQHCKNAFGWQGDRIFYVLKDKSSYGSFVWALSFGTNEDADYMMNAFDKLLGNRKISNSLPDRAESEQSITFTHSKVTTTLFQKDNSIIWVENVGNPLEIAAMFQSNVLAKTSVPKKDYSSLPKMEKWKLIRNMMETANLQVKHLD